MHYCDPPAIVVSDDKADPPIRIDYLVGDLWACPCGNRWVVTLPPDRVGHSTVVVGLPTWTRHTRKTRLRRWLSRTA